MGDQKYDELLTVEVEIGSFLTSSHEWLTHPIIGHKLNGQNYTQWVRLVKIFFQGKGREGYIIEDLKCLKKKDANVQK